MPSMPRPLLIFSNWCGAGDEQRTVLAALHDFEMVRAHFPETLLLAREPVAWGATGDVLTAGISPRPGTCAKPSMIRRTNARRDAKTRLFTVTFPRKRGEGEAAATPMAGRRRGFDLKGR